MKSIMYVFCSSSLILATACESTSAVADLSSSEPTQFDADRCASTNWNELGYKTAMEGTSVKIIESLAQQCNGEMQQRDSETFIEGWINGAAKFCDVQLAYDWGFEGKEHNEKICPEDIQETLNKAELKGIGDKRIDDQARLKIPNGTSRVMDIPAGGRPTR